MRAEQQYIDLFSQCEAMICKHSAEVLNAPRAQAFADLNDWDSLLVNRKSISISMQVSCLSLIMA